MPALSWQQLQDIQAKCVQNGFRVPDMQWFIETGTALGTTAIAMAGHFANVCTIEIKEEFHVAARMRAWEAFGPVHFYHGDTQEVLPSLLASADGAATIFLDAHYTGEGTGKGQVEVPLLEELRCIDALLMRHL